MDTLSLVYNPCSTLSWFSQRSYTDVNRCFDLDGFVGTALLLLLLTDAYNPLFSSSSSLCLAFMCHNCMGGLREKIFSVNGLQYLITVYVKKYRRRPGHNCGFFYPLMDWKMHRIACSIRMKWKPLLRCHQWELNPPQPPFHYFFCFVFQGDSPVETLVYRWVSNVFPAPVLKLIWGYEGMKLWTVSTTVYASFLVS